MIYQWKSGARIKGDAQIAGEMCNQLESEGRLNAQTLVDVNRPEDAPLHNSFEWNDSIAGEEWRKYQARNIIHSLVVMPENKSVETRAFFKLSSVQNNYDSVHTIIQNEDKNAQLLRDAEKELRSFQVKYRGIKKLESVVEAIDAYMAGQGGDS